MEAVPANPRFTSISVPAANSFAVAPHDRYPPVSFSPPAPAVDASSAARFLYEIVARTPPDDLETALFASSRIPSSDCVEEVLKLLNGHGSPDAAIKFFRWAGHGTKHSTYSWNLMVDLLGKNQMFEEMWDAIRSMKQMGVLALPTFVSVFHSYCAAGRLNSAFMTFDVMDKYGVPRDVIALNSLLSAIFHAGDQTSKAFELFEKFKRKITPDADTFAILLEGLEKEGNVAKAKTTFGEMIVNIGWNSQNMPAYDAFLSNLVRGMQADEAMKFLKVMKGNGCLPSVKFFTTALDVFVRQNDAAHAVLMWDIMVGGGLMPNLMMYNSAIGLLCDNNEIDLALCLLDGMVFHGAFPDSLTYNMIFECLVRNKKVRETSRFFVEMIKNEAPPIHSHCASAVSMLFDGDDPETAIEIWNYMIENHISPLEETTNSLLLGLSRLGRVTELRRFAEDILDRRITIYGSTMDKMKKTFHKEGRSARDTFEDLLKRWNAC